MIRFKPIHLLAAVPLLLSLTGCVAAIPLVAQAMSGATSMTQLCAAVRLPGQTSSLCDRIPLAANTQGNTRGTAGSIVR